MSTKKVKFNMKEAYCELKVRVKREDWTNDGTWWCVGMGYPQKDYLIIAFRDKKLAQLCRARLNLALSRSLKGTVAPNNSIL